MRFWTPIGHIPSRRALRRIASSPWTASIAAALIVFVSGHSLFIQYWEAPFIQGWDASGHAVLGQYYSDHLFPSVWGWASHWYDGMPWPQFYPPLFDILLAIIARLAHGVSYLFLFKALITALQLSVPAIMVLFVARRTKSVGALWITALTGCAFTLAHFPDMESSGMNLASTLDAGLVSQLIGFFFSVVWLDQFLRIERSRAARILGPLFLAGVFLANVHECMSVAIAFATVYALSMFKRRASGFATLARITGLYFIHGASGVLLTACWTLPLYEVYSYFVTISPSHPPGLAYILTEAWIIPLALIVGLWVSCRFKKDDLLTISAVGTATITAIYIFDLFGSTGLPLHVNRWFGNIIFSIPILAGLIWSSVAPHIHSTLLRRCLAIAVIIGTVLSAGAYYPFLTDGFYYRYEQERFSTIETYIRTHADQVGILGIESTSGYTNQPMSKLDASLGEETAGSLTVIFRESSPNSLFLTSVRNALSSDQEGWGFRSYISFDAGFKAQQFSRQLDRARAVGMQSFLARATSTKALFAADPRMITLADFGSWKLFSFKDRVPRASVLARDPVVFYGDMTFKERPIDGYDWARIQEELFYQDRSDLSFVYAADQHLDTTDDFKLSPAIFISAYRYRDIAKAERNILSFARTGSVALVASDDPLFRRLARDAATAPPGSYSFMIVPRLAATPAKKDPIRPQMQDFFQELAADISNRPQAAASAAISVSGAALDDHEIRIDLSGTSSRPVPVLVRSTFFPAWKRIDGGPDPYLASPAFTLIYATSSFALAFTTPWYVYLGWAISCIALCALLAAALLVAARYRAPAEDLVDGER